MSVSLEMDDNILVTPQKEIKIPKDIQEKWELSEAYTDIIGFIVAMNEAVKNKKMTEPCHMSETVQKLLHVLDLMCQWIDDIPPIDQPQRFGNKAYRDWLIKLQQSAEDLLKEALGPVFHNAVHEVSVYLVESVGNYTRIDYGTGHELAFISFLCCLFKIGALQQEDSVAVVFKLFNRYLEMMRKLQLTYRMEPAGSQGVWSLDDFQFIPFIWGSAQLCDHKRLRPKDFPNEDISSTFAKDYMFFGCIQYINKVKSGPFSEHSNQLWNISGVEKWEKVNSGLIKMYKAEVLSKFPVMQHFLFGSLLSIKTVKS